VVVKVVVQIKEELLVDLVVEPDVMMVVPLQELQVTRVDTLRQKETLVVVVGPELNLIQVVAEVVVVPVEQEQVCLVLMPVVLEDPEFLI
jgi:hypothetical protein